MQTYNTAKPRIGRGLIGKAMKKSPPKKRDVSPQKKKHGY